MKPQRFHSTLALVLMLIGFACVIAYGALGGEGTTARSLGILGVVLGIVGAVHERRTMRGG